MDNSKLPVGSQYQVKSLKEVFSAAAIYQAIDEQNDFRKASFSLCCYSSAFSTLRIKKSFIDRIFRKNAPQLMKKLIHALSHLVFWTWNLTFIGLMYIWCLPQIGLDLFQAARSGEVDPTFTASLLALLIIPVVCTLLGFFRLRKYPVLLARLFYGVEAPLFTLCFLRLFLIRELTMASGFTLGLGVVAIAMFGLELLSGYAAYRPQLAMVQMIGHSIILLVGLYAGALLLLYTLPLLAVTGQELLIGFFTFRRLEGIGLLLHPISLLFSFLGISSLLIFFSMPYALVNFYLRAWARIRTAFGKQHSEQKSWVVTGITIAISGLLFIGLQAQPQVKAFDLLTTAGSMENVEAGEPIELVGDRQTQLQNADTIKAGLTNAYLYRYRYLSPWSQSNALVRLYSDAFNLPKASGRVFQNIHNGLISPFLYRGEDSDVQRAADLYAQFFDAPIQKEAISSVRSALRSTANRDETKAGLLNLDQKVVRLASQEVTVDEQGDWANIEVHEQYENPTIEDQEIFYSFSLPESAAISGLWLGDAANPRLLPFVVSPRGAAQQVYNGEVERAKFQRATDPALLEQVGPRQYRLRVFPIPAAAFPESDPTEPRSRLAIREPGKLDLVMTYQALQQDGTWPLPQLTEKRNIFWTDKTSHMRGKKAISLSEDEWFEAALPAKKAKPTAHTVKLSEGFSVTATPTTQKEQQFPANKSLAIVIDSSYSMAEHFSALKSAVDELKPVANKNTLDFYITAVGENAKISTKAIDVDDLEFYGSLQPAEMLQQFAALRGDKAYDAVLLLTDEGSYELAKNQAELPNIGAQLWMVHVDGKVPSAYEDGLLQKLQASRGGVETSVSSTLERVALQLAGETAVDGYMWKVAADEENAQGIQVGFEAIAARQLIYQQSQTLDTSKVAALDKVHAIAKRTSIVTPYSSMLVLVDERQKELLKAAEAGEDRFNREVEDGQDDLTQPDNPLTASIPEPSQVLSIAGCAAALLLLKRKSGATQPRK